MGEIFGPLKVEDQIFNAVVKTLNWDYFLERRLRRYYYSGRSRPKTVGSVKSDRRIEVNHFMRQSTVRKVSEAAYAVMNLTNANSEI